MILQIASKLKRPNSSFGFTLLEVLVTMAIVGTIFAVGSFLDLNIYSRELLASEQTDLISILQKARNRSMNNLYSSSHGVHITEDSFIIFRGSSYLADVPTNEIITRNDNIIITGINDIVFSQFSGNANPTGDILLQDNLQTKTINIKANGLIDW